MTDQQRDELIKYIRQAANNPLLEKMPEKTLEWLYVQLKQRGL